MLTWHGAREHVVFTKSSGDPELEKRPQVGSLPANRTRGYRELRVRARGHAELRRRADTAGNVQHSAPLYTRALAYTSSMALLNTFCSLSCSKKSFFGDKTHLTHWGAASLPRSDVYPLSQRGAVPHFFSVKSAVETAAPKLVTILGKGGAGKTTAAVLLAKVRKE